MRTILPLLLLAACGTKTQTIDDPQMQQSASTLGEQNSTLAEMPSDADDNTVQGNSQAVGGTLQGLVSQHQAVSQSRGIARSPSNAQARQTSESEPVFWDGTELCIDIDWSSAGADIHYDVVLDYTTEGDDVIMDGHYNLLYSIGTAGFDYDYDIQAQYDQLRMSGGCAVSGSVIIDYDIKLGGLGNIPGAGNQDQSGRVEVEYHGCDDIVVSGS